MVRLETYIPVFFCGGFSFVFWLEQPLNNIYIDTRSFKQNIKDKPGSRRLKLQLPFSFCIAKKEKLCICNKTCENGVLGRGARSDAARVRDVGV